jgi:hypothetical protein
MRSTTLFLRVDSHLIPPPPSPEQVVGGGEGVFGVNEAEPRARAGAGAGAEAEWEKHMVVRRSLGYAQRARIVEEKGPRRSHDDLVAAATAAAMGEAAGRSKQR